MTMNCDYDSVGGVILPVENKILPIVHLKLKLTKTHPLFYTFGSGKNGSTLTNILLFTSFQWQGPFFLNEH